VAGKYLKALMRELGLTIPRADQWKGPSWDVMIGPTCNRIGLALRASAMEAITVPLPPVRSPWEKEVAP
jgi:hypothetical protein